MDASTHTERDDNAETRSDDKSQAVDPSATRSSSGDNANLSSASLSSADALEAQPVEKHENAAQMLRQTVTSDLHSIQRLEQTLRHGHHGQSAVAVPIPQDAVQQTGAAMQQEDYILHVCRALMMYGAPTHRLEEHMGRTADVFGLKLQSFYMPGCMIITFNNMVWRSKDVQIVRCTESLNLSKLDDVHAVFKDVIHGKLGPEEATRRVGEIVNSTDKFPLWFRVVLYGLASAAIGPVSFGARPIDLPIIFVLGSLLGFLQLIIASRYVVSVLLSFVSCFVVWCQGWPLDGLGLSAGARSCWSCGFHATQSSCSVLGRPGHLWSSSILLAVVHLIYVRCTFCRPNSCIRPSSSRPPHLLT